MMNSRHFIRYHTKVNRRNALQGGWGRLETYSRTMLDWQPTQAPHDRPGTASCSSPSLGGLSHAVCHPQDRLAGCPRHRGGPTGSVSHDACGLYNLPLPCTLVDGSCVSVFFPAPPAWLGPRGNPSGNTSKALAGMPPPPEGAPSPTAPMGPDHVAAVCSLPAHRCGLGSAGRPASAHPPRVPLRLVGRTPRLGRVLHAPQLVPQFLRRRSAPPRLPRCKRFLAPQQRASHWHPLQRGTILPGSPSGAGGPAPGCRPGWARRRGVGGGLVAGGQRRSQRRRGEWKRPL